MVRTLRERVQGPGTDRFLSPEIEQAVALAASGALVAAVEQEIGTLQ